MQSFNGCCVRFVSSAVVGLLRFVLRDGIYDLQLEIRVFDHQVRMLAMNIDQFIGQNLQFLQRDYTVIHERATFPIGV